MSDYNEKSDIFYDEPPLTYASFQDRLFAVIVDSLILTGIDLVLGLVLDFSWSFILLGWLYDALQDSSSAQATVGKRVMALQVTDLQGSRISFGTASLRHFGKYISFLILLIGYLMMLWDKKGQTLHDRLADTLVLKRNS